MKKPRHYSLHPICQLFPPLSKEELQELAEDIRIKGLLHDIILYEGKILDGRNRYLACPMAGVEPRFSEWKGKGWPLQWVISENLVRRHLTSSQKAVIAHDLLPLLEKEAKERTRLSPGRAKRYSNRGIPFPANGAASRLPPGLPIPTPTTSMRSRPSGTRHRNWSRRSATES